MNKKGFTLIELIIVIAILGVISTLITANFITALKRGRDTKRKSDVRAIAQAAELFYEENKIYPDSTKVNDSIAANGTGELCTEAAGECATKVYMYKVPNDPSNANGYKYIYQTDISRQHYQIYSAIENQNDEAIGVKQSGYTLTNAEKCGTIGTQICRYGISDSGSKP